MLVARAITGIATRSETYTRDGAVDVDALLVSIRLHSAQKAVRKRQAAGYIFLDGFLQKAVDVLRVHVELLGRLLLRPGYGFLDPGTAPQDHVSHLTGHTGSVPPGQDG